MPVSRPALFEGGLGEPISGLGEAVGLPGDALRHLLLRSSGRLRRELRLREEPFAFTRDVVSANGIAGIIRLGPRVEIEVIPKCFGPLNTDWRNDFLVMAAVTKLGRILRREQVAGGIRTEHRDVLSLLAAAFLGEFERLSRVPIRQYVRSSWTDFNVDGELDYSEFWQSHPDGSFQYGVRLSVDNQFMGVISEAASYLGIVSADKGVGQRLRRLGASFHGTVSTRIETRVPGRYGRWQQLYDLALAVRTGFGMQLSSDNSLKVPGFVLNSERGWEDLLAIGLKALGGDLRARVKPASVLGTRFPRMRKVMTYPDLVLNPPSAEGPIVVDAKYKGTADSPVRQISADDLYEALAFLEAQQSHVAVLVYPGGDSLSSLSAGTLVPFDEVIVGMRRVIGATVSTNGVGQTRGLEKFGRQLGHDILKYAMQDVVSVE